jgi:N-hydroxyarylamine O-acetyltransferase
MDNKLFNLDRYLERLNYSGGVQPTEDRLEALHRAQAYTIPFENFDILLGRGITLEPAALYDKLVQRARGGYCFELNGLLLMALQATGFDARALLARVHLVDPPTGRGHQLILVTLQGKQWIADVGFGGPGLRAPIPFELNHVATQDGQTFRLVEAAPFGIMLQTLTDARWQDLYSFDLGQVFRPTSPTGITSLRPIPAHSLPLPAWRRSPAPTGASRFSTGRSGESLRTGSRCWSLRKAGRISTP